MRGKVRLVAGCEGQRQGRIAGPDCETSCRAGLQGPLSFRAKPFFCHFERSTKCEVEKSVHPSQAFPCHCNQSMPPVISSETFFCHFERSTKCEVEKSARRPGQTGTERPGRSLHARRSVEMTKGRLVEMTLLSFRANMSIVTANGACPCHFERSPKGEVEKSEHRQGKANKTHREAGWADLSTRCLVEMTEKAWSR